MQENQLNPAMELKERIWEALTDFNTQTGILVETIEVVHIDASSLNAEGKAWMRDRIEIHFKAGVYR